MRKRTKIRKEAVVLCALIVILVVGVLLYFVFFKAGKVKVILSSNLTTEIHEDVNVLSFVQDVKHGEIISQDENIDTSSLGEKEIHLKIKNEQGKEEDYVFKVQVVDTTKPVITAENSLTVLTGTDIELLKDVMVTDNSGEKIDVQVNGEYDINQVGDYALQYVAKDSSQNEATQDFTLHIKRRNTRRLYIYNK